MITSLLTFFISVLFPSYCYVCKKEKTSLCKKCTDTFSRATDAPYPFIVSLYSFKDKNVRKIIHAIKYFHRKDLIQDFTENGISYKNIESIENLDAPVIIPIPTTLFRKLKRGYCHTEHIAIALGERLGYPVSLRTLQRKHFTAVQVGMKRRERLKAQKGTFLIKNTHHIEQKTVILVDDVTTTGATLLEARKLLLSSGAKNVVAITLAH